MINIIVITWFVVGFIMMIGVHLYSMRGENYNEDYFDFATVIASIVIVLLGYITPVISFIYWIYNNRFFTKLLYKIANTEMNK